MAWWLFKQEPQEYSYADLERDGSTSWEGVTNALALNHLRSVQAGDRVFLYHTGDEKAIVGIMVVTDVTVSKDDPDFPVVRVRAVDRLPRPVSLAEIKLDPRFADWELVRISRLSVMPVTDAIRKMIEQLARGQAMTPKGKYK